MSLAPFCKKCESKHWGFKECLKAPDPAVVETVKAKPPQQNVRKGLKFPKVGTEFRSHFGVPFTRSGTKTRFAREGFNK